MVFRNLEENWIFEKITSYGNSADKNKHTGDKNSSRPDSNLKPLPSQAFVSSMPYAVDGWLIKNLLWSKVRHVQNHVNKVLQGKTKSSFPLQHLCLSQK